MPIPTPDPPLTDGVIRLRAWGEDDGDVAALVLAWADEEIRKWTSVPEDRSEAHAAEWIAGAYSRQLRSIAIDLVVSPADPDDFTVLGEVGLVTMLGGPARAEMGWWVAAPHRRQGIATRAVQLLAGWARGVLEFELFAEVDPDNPPSIWVAESAGLRLRLRG